MADVLPLLAAYAMLDPSGDQDGRLTFSAEAISVPSGDQASSQAAPGVGMDGPADPSGSTVFRPDSPDAYAISPFAWGTIGYGESLPPGVVWPLRGNTLTSA